VLDYFRTEYRAGRTPNPCVRCNQSIKFGALHLAARKMGIEFDHFATGHYARLDFKNENEPFLYRALDTGKDQTYFLSRLSAEQLSTVLFPLGNMHKQDVKALAAEIGWDDFATKRESQDFIECGDYSVLFEESDQVPGDFVDVNGKVLSTISEGKFNVFKRDDYKQQYPLTVIDSPDNSRCWVFQITTDKEENPVVAFVRISPDKKQHEYYYARWNGGKWRITDIADAGKWFHQSPQTENCYSAGMAIDPDDVNTVYCSLPTKNLSGKEVYEIWKYTLNEAGVVTTKEAITWNSEKNNMRPYVLPGSVGSDLRVVWMNGDYYYWLKCSRFPEGYPTRIMGKLDSGAALSISPLKEVKGEKNMKRTKVYSTSLNSADGVKTVDLKGKRWYIDADVKMDAEHYTGVLLKAGDMEYGVDEESLKPYIKIGGKTYFSANKLGNSDDWTKANGTDGKWYFKKLNQFHLSIVRQGKSVTVYRDGLIDIKN
jgi:hypothetical protein